MKKIRLKALWQSLLFAVILIGFIGGAYISGTFNPNSKTVENLQDEFHKQEINKVALLGLKEPAFEYNGPNTFIEAVSKCVDYINFTTERQNRIPTSIIIAMAGVESAWGKSRFAIEGNNLFGIRTWDLENVAHIKPKDIPDAKFGVKVYETKCDSVQDMINILNNHPAYEDFRIERAKQLKKNKWHYQKLLEGIKAWSTNVKYPAMIYATIVDKQLP